MTALLDAAPDIAVRPLRLRLVPIASVLLGSLLATAPIAIDAPLMPPLGFMLLIAWRLLRSDIWPVWIGIPLGLFDDLLSGQPVGSAVALWTLTMLAMDALDTRVVWRDYRLDWLIAAAALAFVLVGGGLLARVGSPADVLRLIAPQLGWSLCLVPLAMLLTAGLDRWRLRQ